MYVHAVYMYVCMYVVVLALLHVCMYRSSTMHIATHGFAKIDQVKFFERLGFFLKRKFKKNSGAPTRVETRPLKPPKKKKWT